jgi:3-deoxy-D-manno-octulosonic-acid transferase
MKFLYSASVLLYKSAIHLASAVNPKARKWVRGRKDIFSRIEAALQQTPPGSPLVWFHCASLGEFEQGRPLIEKYRQQHPGTRIFLSFFSPSGYEVRKDYKGADYIFYLPADTPSNARRLVKLLQPSAAFFIKYEFWFNYLEELKKQGTPVYLVSGIFRKDQHFFRSYGGWFRKGLSAFKLFFVQDQNSADLLFSIGMKNVVIAGDTRFDRVAAIAEQKKEIPSVAVFCQGHQVIIAGSTWQPDEEVLHAIPLRDYKMKMIIAAHEIHEEHLAGIEKLFSDYSCLRFSKASPQELVSAEILIIDSIGLLSSLYQYGSFAFIGGGYGKGIHNILEAATFGLPVLFGPNYHKFIEARDLVKTGGAFEISDSVSLLKTVQLLQDKQVLETASHIARHYVLRHTGATDKILQAISA